MGDGRRFNDKEVRTIITRAIEMQQRELTSNEDGIRQVDVESMARELGVPVENVQEAIRELDSGQPGEQRSAVLGEVTVARTTRTVPVVLARDHLQELGAALPTVMGETGQSSVFGKSVSYSTGELEAMRSGSRTQITIHAGEHQTLITASEDMRNVAGGVFGGLVGGFGGGVGFGVGFGVGLGALGSPLFAALFPFVAVGGAFLGARALYRGIVRSKRRRTQDRIERIIRYVTENGATPRDDADTHPVQ